MFSRWHAGNASLKLMVTRQCFWHGGHGCWHVGTTDQGALSQRSRQTLTLTKRWLKEPHSLHALTSHPIPSLKTSTVALAQCSQGNVHAHTCSLLSATFPTSTPTVGESMTEDQLRSAGGLGLYCLLPSHRLLTVRWQASFKYCDSHCVCRSPPRGNTS